ncbi:MAG: gamma-glutamylcyclotransferase [Actinomycetota bacterium]
MIWGVVYETDAVGRKQIDDGQRAAGYREEPVTVVTRAGVEHHVSVYVAGADLVDGWMMPMRSYRDPIVDAARSIGLPAQYVDNLAQTPVADP